ncbi:MAG: hypothetical protein JXA11_02065 [Phycisphaerae bacterium]|nr:hypothetical protein [Phycisphaerae bacterium]
MNEQRILQTLATAAQGDGPPSVDVAGIVMRRIQKPARRANFLLWTYAAATAVAACFVAAWTAHVLLLEENAALDIIAPVMGALP